MAKNTPAFQFYPSDFIGGVTLLSDEATGVYIKLLSQLWIQGNLLPFSFPKLAAISMTTPEVMHRVWPELEDKFIIEDGNVMHARFQKMMEISEKRRDSGGQGGRTSKANRKQTAKQNKSKESSKSEANSLAISMTTPEVMHRVWPELEDKFIIEDGNVMHARFQKMMEISEKRRDSGGQGGRTSKANRKQTAKQNKSKESSKSEANSLKNEERRLKTEDSSLKDDWKFPDGWDSPSLRNALDDWADMRTRIRKPVKSRASTSKIFKKFDSPEHLAEVAEHCEANEYQGLNPDYCRGTGGTSNRPSPAQQTAKNAQSILDQLK